MAQRRMFSMKIVDSDAFLEMPPTTQLLYFHLAMRADDDGFVGSPKKITRMIGSNDDDFKILIAKRFILNFESGIIVIKHWKIHNYIQNDRYSPSQYVEEKKSLTTKENGAYTECIQNGYKSDTQVRLELGKVRIGKVRKQQALKTSKKKETITKETSKAVALQGKEWNKVIDLFEPINPFFEEIYKNTTERKAIEFLVEKIGMEKLIATVRALPEITSMPYAPKITKPSELRRDFGKLLAFYRQNSNKGKSVSIIL